MAERTDDRHLHAVLMDRSEGGVSWLSIDDCPRTQQRELLRLLREAADPSASFYATDSSVWEGPLTPFAWALESMARLTADPSLRSWLQEIAREGPYCLELDQLSPTAYAEVVRLLPTLPAVARDDPDLRDDAAGALAHIDALSRMR
ncbi:hypothetical protein [Cellulomonas fimi]|uniref:Uncharacterized protein n=1 Tax=Cellulomonas fimi (strain ATCC 484 / DSM 20113 / JCM 1341 / CCUG 24087 / LMG 16345 / NBRC 15513 / NCIMB 8980 / NCTC 7547 / NRS-133) TaxID=590998 RepID=F4H590_CELFA|nr:hypothetical protein [Cellulomonas fimi]AEE46696.1 hypothetical protein Celf_2571 [Cellulomonas fimi ATCC 484]NNH07659.1 hypothetical protein [Cellulomonas fimi]VEH33912.1 Uncharacterised protein [Cellulomonas fimi]